MGGQQGRNDAGRGSPVHQHRAWQDARSTLKKYVKNNIFISEKEYCFSTLFYLSKENFFSCLTWAPVSGGTNRVWLLARARGYRVAAGYRHRSRGCKDEFGMLNFSVLASEAG
jgi:hypothetical protein